MPIKETIETNKNTIECNRNKVANGIYFFPITEQSKVIATGKLIVQ